MKKHGHLQGRVASGEVFAEGVAAQRDALLFLLLFLGHDGAHGLLRAFSLPAELLEPLRLGKRGRVLGIVHCVQKLLLLVMGEV